MMNKYADVGVVLGTIADYIRANGGSPIEREYHAVLRRMIGILEEQAQEDEKQKQHLADAISRIANLELKLQKLASSK
jgi:uncharacterized protein (DUF2267 family)